MQYIGIDIIEIIRIKEAIAQWGDRFLERVYTENELTLYRNRPDSLAARFAGKEAVMKALSPQDKLIAWKEVEILSKANGRPYVHLYGKARDQAKRLGLDGLAISLSHSKVFAIALASAESAKHA